MKLSPAEVEKFYSLLWGLMHYVNSKEKVIQAITSPQKLAQLSTKEKLKIRQVLWKHPERIDSFVHENPQNLAEEDLEILRRWGKYFVSGQFFILRHLKSGTIFVQSDRVYSVVGLQNELEEIIPSYVLPYIVEAVLLPFRGRIVYDGILSGYDILVGMGIRSELNHTYKVAKERSQIIASLEADRQPAARSEKRALDLLPRLEELFRMLNTLKGESNLQKAGIHLARLSLELTAASIKGEELQPIEKRLRRAMKRLGELLEILREA